MCLQYWNTFTLYLHIFHNFILLWCLDNTVHVASNKFQDVRLLNYMYSGHKANDCNDSEWLSQIVKELKHIFLVYHCFQNNFSPNYLFSKKNVKSCLFLNDSRRRSSNIIFHAVTHQILEKIAGWLQGRIWLTIWATSFENFSKFATKRAINTVKE